MLDSSAETKRAAVLSAAIRTFLDYGFKRTTMDDIAKAAGMSRPALYLVYKNKKDIYRACVTDMLETLKERLEEIIASEAAPQESVYAILEAGIINPFRLLAQTAHGQEIFDMKSELAADLFEAWMGALEATTAATLKRAAENGKIALDDARMKPEDIAAVIVDGAEGIKLRMGEDGDIEGRIHALLDLILRPLLR
ncbi:TetR/AcrR family transcriptional regulator [Rhizobium sp. L1K21]|uniref:TetR/AcrR family transcriptional regulator n=1 Tax=Rhizobium sp. L1K21 TaxID=2954933 RepID=UPI002092BEF3|nr:TetR/AcrR family transcriptional regulator [Rhizobium sp. L1K21]MCO6188113.1 TetR/AcrR family transcriptional regulator [Rhizobium sp. L1K21]